MPIPWLVVLQSVPWTDVIRNAPKVSEAAKKLWSTVGKKAPAGDMPAGRTDAALSPLPTDLAGLHARIASLDAATSELQAQMLASSELIKTLADQNTQLVARMEAHRVRVVWLGRAVVALGLIAVVTLYWVFKR